MSHRPPDVDVFDMSSFSSLIQKEELEEIIPLDLYTASLIGDYDAVRGFIAIHEDLDKVNTGGWTALMYAAYVGRDNILNMLLEAGAKIDIPAKRNGLTALMLASYCASESIMYFLLQHGAAINARDSEGLTSLFHAVRQGHQSAVKLLAAQGAELDLCQYQTGMTPLMEAVVLGHEAIFSILLEQGGDFTRRTKKGETVRNLAVRYGNTMIVNLIDKASVPMNSSLREEPKIPDSMFSRNQNSSDIANLNDGPNQIMHMQQKRMNTQPQQPKPLAALCPDFGNLMVHGNHGNSTPSSSSGCSSGTDGNHLQMSGISQSTSGGYPSGSQMNNGASQRKKMSRVASVPPTNIYSSNSSQDFAFPLPSTLKEVMEEYKLDAYLSKFETQGIDLNAFLSLSDNDLKEVGVDKLGPRKKILIAIGKCKQRLKTQQSPSYDGSQVEQLQAQIQDLNMQLQQSYTFIKHVQATEQQYRTEVTNYLEHEQQRMRQIIFYTNDVGKSCKEALGQVRKIKEFNEKIHMFLQKIKAHPNQVNISNELAIDASIFDESASVKCEVEMVTNRLEMTFKQVERTLMVAQLDMQQASAQGGFTT